MSRTVIGITGIALSMLASAASAQWLGGDQRSPVVSGAGDTLTSAWSRDVVRNIQP